MSAKNANIAPLAEQLKMQSRLFNNVLQDFSNQYSSQPNDKTNNPAWLAGHVLYSRLNLANLIGLNEPNPYKNLYDDFKGLDDESKYPAIAEVKSRWNDLSGKLALRLENITDEQLNAPAPFQLPIGDSTMKGVIAFFAHHEAYHIGQLAFIRRYYGLEPMSYN